MILKKIIGMTLVLLFLVGLVASTSFAVYIDGTTTADKKADLKEEEALIDQKLNQDAAQGKMAGEVDMENQFSNQTQGLGQQIGDSLNAQAELENKGSGDWIDPEKTE